MRVRVDHLQPARVPRLGQTLHGPLLTICRSACAGKDVKAYAETVHASPNTASRQISRRMMYVMIGDTRVGKGMVVYDF